MTPLYLLKLIGPYLLAAALGGWCAWELQGVRLDAAHNELVAYKLAAEAEVIAEKTRTDHLNKDVTDEFAKSRDALARRTLPRRVLPATAGQAPAVSDATDSTDAATAEPATGAGGITAPLNIQACALDAQQVLYLQGWIKAVGAE